MARYENEQYVEASGSVRANPEGEAEVVLEVPGQGTLYAPAWFAKEFEIGAPVHVLVGRRDTTDFKYWDERAQPVPWAVASLALLAAAAACVGGAWVLVRRGTFDASRALGAAAEPVEPDRPATAAVPGSVTGVPPLAGRRHRDRDGRGGLQRPVRREVLRPLAADDVDPPADDRRRAGEARRGHDGGPVRHRVERLLHRAEPSEPAVGNRLGRRRRRAAPALARGAPARRANAATAGAVRRMGPRALGHHVARPRAVRLDLGSRRTPRPAAPRVPVPDAVRGILWTRGRLRAGGAVVVHARDGAAKWPVGRVRGPLTAAVLGPSPPGRHAWFLPARPGATVRRTT